MRVLLPITLAGLAMLFAASFGQAQAQTRAPLTLPAVVSPQEAPPVDDNDDSRVTVQLIVAGIAAGVVVVVGSGAYLLRRKLGLVAPPPEPGAGQH